MKKLLIVLFGVLAFQGFVFAESWEDWVRRASGYRPIPEPGCNVTDNEVVEVMWNRIYMQ